MGAETSEEEVDSIHVQDSARNVSIRLQEDAGMTTTEILEILGTQESTGLTIEIGPLVTVEADDHSGGLTEASLEAQYVHQIAIFLLMIEGMTTAERIVMVDGGKKTALESLTWMKWRKF